MVMISEEMAISVGNENDMFSNK